MAATVSIDPHLLSATFGENLRGISIHRTDSTNLTTIAANAAASTTFTVPDAKIGDPVLVSNDTNLNNAAQITAYVSAADTVTVRVGNNSGAAIDPAASVFTLIVFHLGAIS